MISLQYFFSRNRERKVSQTRMPYWPTSWTLPITRLPIAVISRPDSNRRADACQRDSVNLCCAKHCRWETLFFGASQQCLEVRRIFFARDNRNINFLEPSLFE